MSLIDRRQFLASAAAVTTTAGAVPRASNTAVHCRDHVQLPLPDQPLVEITAGWIRGIECGDVRSFKGIPYGASTAGPNRFRAPQPPKPWSGVREALNYGPECPAAPGALTDRPFTQGPQDAFLLYRNYTPHTPNEDCLRLNVWAPMGAARRPVMVWMHGGGFFAGSGNDLLAYDGANLARRGDVVVVTHNHRLNIFGYLDLSRFGGRWAESVNVGMQDIVAVLKWVRENIAAFGGDPENVTIFGQSGGGAKVLTLMAMPSARGLFHKAIIESGVFPGYGSITMPEAHELSRSVLAELGISEKSPDKLATLPPERLCVAAVAGRRPLLWSPVIDGMVLPTTPGLEATALSPGTPLIVGSVLNELENPVDDPRAADFSEADLRLAARKTYRSTGRAIVAAYQHAYPHRAPIELWFAMQAAGIRTLSFELAARKYVLDRKAWQYLFTWATPMLEGRPKTFHSAEIAFVFDNAGLCMNQTGGGREALRLAARSSDAWTAFAHAGNPNHPGLASWPAFDAPQPTMIFDNECEVQDDPEAEGRQLILEALGGRWPGIRI